MPEETINNNEAQNNRYVNYQSMVATVTTGLAQLEDVCRHIEMNEQAEALKETSDKLKNHIFSVGIMGEFRRGKSTVINALLGQSVVPSDIVPTSATLNYIRWANEKRGVVNFKDGRIKDVSIEELPEYITKITEANAKVAATVKDATVYYPCPFCQNGVQIIDTPGLNDDEHMTQISEEVLPKLDAIVMVITPDSPFSISEAEFVRNKVMSSDLGRIIFLLNKIDNVDEDDREKLLDNIKKKIATSVLEKMEIVYGRNSEEYSRANLVIGNINVIPVSARQALKGKTKNNAELLNESGFLVFEEALSKMLTEERGALQLIVPVNKITSTAKVAVDTIKSRVESLRLETNEFERIQSEAKEKIRETREQKREQIHNLKAKGKNLYYDLIPQVNELYDEIEQNVNAYIEQYPILGSDVADQTSLDSLCEKIGNDLENKVTDEISICTERLVGQLKNQLGRDVDDLKEFSTTFEGNMSGIRSDISQTSAAHIQVSGAGVGTVALEMAVSLAGAFTVGSIIPGIGGIIAGYKEHGIKGALAGGLSGGAIGLGASVLAMSLGIAGLPLLLIGAAASTFGGKAVVRKLFGSRRQQQTQQAVTPDSIRENLYTTVNNIVNDLRRENKIEIWLKETCEEAYSSLAGNIDQEWENALISMEHSLVQIESDIKMSDDKKKQRESEMVEKIDLISRILNDIKPINDLLAPKAQE